GHGLAPEVPVDVADRGPLRVGVLAVDVPGDALELVAQLAVAADRAARDRRHLQQGEAPGLVGVAAQELAERLELLRQALGIVEAVDADRELALAQAVAQAAVARRAARAGGDAGELAGVDADRKRLRARQRARRPRVQFPAAGGVAQVGVEVLAVAL